MPATVLRGEGVYPRPAEIGDLHAWSNCAPQSRAFLTPWEPIWPADDLTRSAFRRRLRRHTEEWSATNPSRFSSLTRATTFCSAADPRRHPPRRRPGGDARLLDGRPHAGKGHMTRAVAAAVRFGFATLRLHRIEAACIPDNAPSIALLQRNGFRREGLARAYLKINDAWRDHVLFALVDGEATRLD